MAKATLTVEFDVPEGYEYTGEFRHPVKGETFLRGLATGRYSVDTASYTYESVRSPILRKTQVWHQLTPEKALEFMLTKKEVTLKHVSWPPLKSVTKIIDKIYYHNKNYPDLSIDLDCQGLIKNIRYLED